MNNYVNNKSYITIIFFRGVEIPLVAEINFKMFKTLSSPMVLFEFVVVKSVASVAKKHLLDISELYLGTLLRFTSASKILSWAVQVYWDLFQVEILNSSKKPELQLKTITPMRKDVFTTEIAFCMLS